MARAEQRGLILSGEQADALAHVTDGRDLGIVVGYAGTGKSAMLGVAREAWEASGYEVRGVALSGIAAENLEGGSGIASRTIASMEHGWKNGRDMLTSRDVLVIDEAGMVGTRQMERVLSHAAEAGAKVVLVGDPQQPNPSKRARRSARSMSVTAAWKSMKCAASADWQRDATRDLATGRTGAAIHAYDAHGMVHEAAIREQARDDLIDRWDRDRQATPDSSRIILTHTNAEVRSSTRRPATGCGRLAIWAKTCASPSSAANAASPPGDRVMFLQNERGLGVKNGTLGTIEEVSAQSMTAQTDDGRSITFDLKDYDRIDHGYAATIHKAQGMTVDRTHVLATPGMDAHGSYVALSRHRDSIDLHFGRDDFASQDRLVNTLSRDRAKDMATDYEQFDPAQDYAERRGISFRARVAQIMRRLIPERVRDAVDGILDRVRSPATACLAPRLELAGKGNGPGSRWRSSRSGKTRRPHCAAPVAGLLSVMPVPWTRSSRVRRRTWPRHPDRCRNCTRPVRPSTICGPTVPTMPRRFTSGTRVCHGCGFGDRERAMPARQAVQQETEMRQNPELRADRFVERWRDLKQTGDRQYAAVTIPATRLHAKKWATWRWALSAMRRWNPCSKAARGNSESAWILTQG